MTELSATVESVVKSLAEPLTPLPTETSPELTRLSGIRAVLFDVYGTLLISGSGDVGVASKSSKPQALVDAVHAAGIRYRGSAEQGLEDLHETIANQHTRLKSEGIEFPEVRITQIWSDVAEKWRAQKLVDDEPTLEQLSRLAIEYEMRVNPVWAMPNLMETLNQIQLGRLTLGIVSNAQVFTPQLFTPITGRSLADLGFVPELCFWSYEHQQAKPGTFLYEQAADVLVACGLSPEVTLYVGNDMRNDIWPASQVGFKTALFAGDARSLRLREDDEAVAGTTPDVVLTDLAQLAEVLDLPSVPDGGSEAGAGSRADGG